MDIFKQQLKVKSGWDYIRRDRTKSDREMVKKTKREVRRSLKRLLSKGVFE